MAGPVQSLLVGGQDLSDVLDDFDKVQVFGSGQYIEPGKMLMRIASVEIKKGHKGISAIGTNEVAHIWSSEDAQLKLGDNRNLVEPMIGPNASIGKSNLKAYLLAACEGLFQQKIDVKRVSKDFVIPLLQPNQLLAGVFVVCEAFKKPKVKNPLEMITVKNWRSIMNAELAAINPAFVQPPYRGT